MNKWKHKVGCLVPECQTEYCDRNLKKNCALRKYYLLERIRIKREKMITHANKKDRNREISKQIRELADLGYQIQKAIRIVAAKYYLSPETVRSIWYK